jgi:hypothetical protein
MYYSSVTIVWLLFAVLTPEEFLPCWLGNHVGSGRLARTSSLFGKWFKTVIEVIQALSQPKFNLEDRNTDYLHYFDV